MKLNQKIVISEQTFDMTTGFPTPITSVLYPSCFASIEFTSGELTTENGVKSNHRRGSFTIRYRTLPDSLIVEHRGLKYVIDSIIPSLDLDYMTLQGVVQIGS